MLLQTFDIYQQKINSRFKTFHLAGFNFAKIGISRYKCSHTKANEKTSDDESHHELVSLDFN